MELVMKRTFPQSVMKLGLNIYMLSLTIVWSLGKISYTNIALEKQTTAMWRTWHDAVIEASVDYINSTLQNHASASSPIANADFANLSVKRSDFHSHGAMKTKAGLVFPMHSADIQNAELTPQPQHNKTIAVLRQHRRAIHFKACITKLHRRGQSINEDLKLKLLSDIAHQWASLTSNIDPSSQMPANISNMIYCGAPSIDPFAIPSLVAANLIEHVYHECYVTTSKQFHSSRQQLKQEELLNSKHTKNCIKVFRQKWIYSVKSW